MSFKRKLLGISLKSMTPKTVVLSRGGLSTIFNMLSRRKLHWLENVQQTKDEIIPKYILYEKLNSEIAILDAPNYTIRMCASGA